MKKTIAAIDYVMGEGYDGFGNAIKLPWPNVVLVGDKVDEEGMPVISVQELLRRQRQIEKPRRGHLGIVIK